jgi:hypothetical protein
VLVVGGEQRDGIGARREERDEAQVQKAGQADFEVQAHAHQDVKADQHEHLAEEGARGHREQQEQDDRDGVEEVADGALAAARLRAMVDHHGLAAHDPEQGDDEAHHEHGDEAAERLAFPREHVVADRLDAFILHRELKQLGE